MFVALLVNYVLYISIANTFYSIFPCMTLDEGTYMHVDLSVSCNSARYTDHWVIALLGIEKAPEAEVSERLPPIVCTKRETCGKRGRASQ